MAANNRALSRYGIAAHGLAVAAKVNAIAGENIISQLRDRAAVGELSSSELAALTEGNDGFKSYCGV